MHKAHFEQRDEWMNPAWEEGMATHMLSLEGGGGAGQAEKKVEEQVGKGMQTEEITQRVEQSLK